MNKQGELLQSGKRRSPGGRLFSMFLALCMIVSMLPVSAMAEEIHTTVGGSGEIISFAPLTETEKTVSPGKSGEDLELPETLTATVRTAVPADENPVQDSGSSQTAIPATTTEPQWEETTVEIPVTWVSLDYDMNTGGEYVFTPVVEGYTVSATLPEIVVTVGEMPPIAAALGSVAPMSTTNYGIWVGGVQVTDENKDNITGTGITGNVTYDSDTNTLTLNGANITDCYTNSTSTYAYGIYLSKDSTVSNLTIHLVGVNMITPTSSATNVNGIWIGEITAPAAVRNLTFTADVGATLNVSVLNSGVGIYCHGPITIEDGTINATGYNGIYSSSGSVTINGGNVTANSNSSATYGSGIASNGSLHITAGTVTASSPNGYGVNTYNVPNVTGGTLTATGGNQAIVFDNGSLSASDGMQVTASANEDGSNQETYNASSLANYKYIKVEPAASDTTGPTITSVTVPTNGDYSNGDTLNFTVAFYENVTVNTSSGTPYLSLTVGSTSRYATYVSGSGTQNLVFRYTVQAGDSDSDGISIGSLILNGGTIRDTAGNNAILTLNGVGTTTGIRVNPPAPSISVQPSPQTVNEGQSATFSVTATGMGLTYQWQVNTGSGFTNITSGGVYSGASTTTLNITGATAGMNGYLYRVVVTGTYSPIAISNSALLTVTAAPIKSVSVGPQSGTATAGTAGSLTYTVTTANITNGTYAVSIANLPAGVTIGNSGNVTISGNSGTLTLTVADTAAAGTTGTLALTLDGATSAAFSIAIGEPAPIPNLSVADVTLDAVTVGYMSSNYKSVVITNSGDAQATISNVTTDRPSVFSIHSGQSVVAANGSINSWQIKAATGLLVGTHTATITVTYDGGLAATATVSITVNAVGNYTVTFNPNGGTVGEATRSVAPGTAVGALPTPTRSGSYSFDGWYTAASGGTQISAGTTVSANVTYYAHWTYTGGGGSGGGGGSSSNDNSSPVIVTPPAPDKPNSPTQGEIKVSGTVDSKGNITVNITGKTVTDAFDKALAEGKKNGTEQNGITVVLRVDTGNKTGSNITVNLPKAVQDTIISKKIVNTIVVVDNPDIRIGMDLATVQEINKQAKSDVNIAATRTDSGKLTGDAKKAIGSRPVFDLKVNYGNGKAVSSFGAGSVSVTIPYTLGANEKAGNVQAVYVDAKGKVHWLTNSVYDSVEKVLRFSTNHFSTYGIGYMQTNTAFKDIAGHWAKEDIEFVVSRGLFSGTSETKFSPNAAMTRGMFVTVLGRLASADVSGYAKSSFSDVKSDAYYMGYIEWASKNNIVNGVGNGRFAPDQSITREQMAVIMSNYAKTISYTLPKVHVENIFADNGKISAYAKEAVKQMQMAGVISGKNGNLFDPQGTATRAEVSAVLRRFVELAISSDTAQGWTMNDSGKWMYFKDGKPLTGKQDIDGVTYTFDQYGVTADVPKNLRYTTYIVQKGDSFWLIAYKLGCTMSELERLNNKSRFSIIYPGDVLRVPEK